MEMPPTVGSRPVGPVAGGLLGLVAGGLVFAAWVNDLLLGIAVAFVIGGLIGCVFVAGAGWQRFGAGLLVGAVVAVVVCVAVLRGAP
jgi:hypothetical protein